MDKNSCGGICKKLSNTTTIALVGNAIHVIFKMFEAKRM